MRTSSRALLMTALLASGLLACVAAQSQQGNGSTGVRITVLLYSGRPNPTFTLDAPADLDRLRQLVAAAHEDAAASGAKGGSVLPSILGYNGLLVDNRSGVTGVPGSLALYKNRLEIRGAQPKFLADAGEMEQFLLEKAVEKQALSSQEQRFLEASRARGKT